MSTPPGLRSGGPPPPAAPLRPLDPFRRRSTLSGHAVGVVWVTGGAAALVCAVVAAFDGGRDAPALAATGVVAAALGAALLRLTAAPRNPSARQLFRAVVTGAAAAIVLAAVPFVASPDVGSVGDAVVEAVSGVTTTGATILGNPARLGQGLLLWRALTQWLGGAGIVLVIVSVFPHLGLGGFQPGAARTRNARRLSARMSDSARRLGAVYVVVTAAVALGYLAVGLGPFESVANALTTASTGGFTTRSASMASFASAGVEWVAAGGMFVAGMSLPLLWRAVVRRDRSSLLGSFELRVYVGATGALTLGLYLWNASRFGYGADAVRSAVFVSVSALSTTGFTVGELVELSPGSDAVLVLAMGTGAMAASVAGGLTLVRVLAMGGYVRRELVRQLHPRLHAPVRIGPTTLTDEATSRMMGSVSITLGLVVAGAFALTLLDVDMTTALSAAVASVSNAGPALVEGRNTSYLVDLDPVARWVLAALMVLGRVQVFPVLMVAGEGIALLTRRLPPLPRPGRPGERFR